MMNLLALGLLVSSLVAAGVWAPPPETPKPRHPDSLVREGHRLIVVEYERQVPPDHSPPPSESTRHFIEEAKEKFHEAASHLPNVGQGLSTPTIQSQSPSTKDQICDAYGVCKDKLSTLVGKGKDKITEKASKVEENAKDTAKDVMDKASQLKEAAKDGEGTWRMCSSPGCRRRQQPPQPLRPPRRRARLCKLLRRLCLKG